ncbi:peptide chain release factor 3, partial [Aureispira]|nr:peptide chain release factor 3 [Aureispira sp.]
VMGFNYKGCNINILDTPGHKDFAEDTYRTLTAVDSVIVVIDVAKGVEEQTERLVEVCRMRKTPVIVFVNKLDREGKDGFDLLDEIEEKMKLTTCPLSWPIGMGQDFKGVYNIYKQQLNLFSPNTKYGNILEFNDIMNPELVEHIGQDAADTLRDEIETITGVYPEFDQEQYLNGQLSPVFFGSAINNFGVKELLDCFIEVAPSPIEFSAEERNVNPYEKKFSGFVFKIHANMDPRHRDRIAFLRVCSGIFKRNTNYLHIRKEKKLKFSNPTTFMASKKEVVDNAYPGDIVGLYDSGNFKIGDTLTEGEILHFKGIPSFSPEMFKYIENAEPMKSKQLSKGINQLMDEGVAQLFTKNSNNRKIIGTVGQLQFEVLQYRLKHEYTASCIYSPIQLYKACWIASEDKDKLAEFIRKKANYMAKDKEDRDVYLAESKWMLQTAQTDYPELSFYFTSEF